ncbi:MAG: primosomal protein N' [Prevotella sp.]|nr:primosomal protein N' [Prevotella sp.]
MGCEKKYVDVILPLPLPGCFTYSVPEAVVSDVRVGMRVLVPLGKSKQLIGVVKRLHDVEPQGIKVKDLCALPDQTAIATETQLRLWQWIADYYMAPIGDVMKAALPAGMKCEDGYRPKTETYIRFTPGFSTEQGQHIALDMLRRADGQRRVVETFIGMETPSVSKTRLMNESHTTLTIMKSLVKRGILETFEQETGRLNQNGQPHPERIKPLTTTQAEALEALRRQWETKPTVLLHGVTGSGKTELYIHLIQHEIDRGRQVLYLLPEIALTVQMMDRLQRVFGSRMGIYHSRYSDAERVEIWRKQLTDNAYDIILGARSAVFLPMQRLGLVIIDEEHETSFKQAEPSPRYHARSVALMLARMSGARTVLGTATPSVETYHNAMRGKYGIVKMEQRYAGLELPEVEIVDVKRLQKRREMSGQYSPNLLGRLRETLVRGEQALLFQNRRGFSPMIECRTCGWVPRCPNCDVSLTLHRRMSQLTCHYCGHVENVPERCPACDETKLSNRGYGTERIEEQLHELVPEARVARMDLDTTRTRDSYEHIISDFGSGRTNVLIGTQMISKGLDFDRVSLVGILQADQMMNVPDFRAYEHAFQMMTQVSGRAGRKGHRGLVVLQTRQPEHPLLPMIQRADYNAMYHWLIEERRQFGYPPFTHLIDIYLKHRDERVVDSAAHELASRLRMGLAERILGPDSPHVARVKQMHIRKIIVKLEMSLSLTAAKQYLLQAEAAMIADKRYGKLELYYDVDPS